MKIDIISHKRVECIEKINKDKKKEDSFQKMLDRFKNRRWIY